MVEQLKWVGDDLRFWVFKGLPYRWNPDLRDGKGDLEELPVDLVKIAEIRGISITTPAEPSRHAAIDWSRVVYFRVWIDGRYESIPKQQVIAVIDTDGDWQDAPDEREGD